jgi:penicillin-binding protein 2
VDRSSPRLKLLALLVAFMFAALSTRLWYLQVLAAEKYKGQIFNNTVKLFDVPALRGRILASNGAVLVDSRASQEVLVEQQRLGPDAEAVLLRLSKLLKTPVRKIRAELSSNQYYPSEPIPVAVDVAPDAIAYIAENKDEFPGVSWMTASVRQYPNGDLAAHILGSVGRITAEQAKQPMFKNSGPSDIVGRSGLESEYERWLRGQPGIQKYLVNAAGKRGRQLGQENPVAGSDVRLYLNLRFQRIVEEKLKEGILNARHVSDTGGGLLKATAGAAVVLDPKTLGIQAIASYPTFNPTAFVGGIPDAKFKRLYQRLSEHQPLYDRAIQASYAPGSTFKPFVALSAIQNGLASTGGSYSCPASYTYPGDTSGTVFHNWTTTDLGFMSLSNAIKISCDTVFYQFGGEFYSKFYAANQLGTRSEPLQKDLRGFGFGRDSGIDLPASYLPASSAGLIPTAQWKQQFAPEHPNLFRPDERTWLPGDDINMAIGQGFVQVSPLQLAAAYAAIANGGKLCAPRLAQDVQRPDGKVLRPIRNGSTCRKLPYTPAQLSYMRHAMAQVVQPGGTAGLAFAGFPTSRVAVEGKTGTAQRAPLQDTSWFAAMVGGTVDAPEHIIVVMVEQGGHGSTTAAPIVRSIIESMYHLPAGAHFGGTGSQD